MQTLNQLIGLDPLHLAIALGPLGAYLLVLGALNLGPRSFCTTGARDAAGLGVALSGFALVGPLQLFCPEAALVHFGGFAWLLLSSVYVLAIVLVVLLIRPRLVIFNTTPDQLRPILANAVAELDSSARWAGDSLALPQLGVQLHIEPFLAMRTVQLVSSGPSQSYHGWRRLERSLTAALQDTAPAANPYAFSLVLFGLVMVAMVTVFAVRDSQGFLQALYEMLRL